MLRSNLLAPLGAREALTPLYAFLAPALRPAALVFAVLATATVVLGPRWVEPTRTPGWAFGALLAASAGSLALGLFLVRLPLEELGQNFDLYRHEEFWHDALAIGSASDFLARHVELLPTLSTHGRHFPPGHALLLHAVVWLCGPSLLAAGALVLAAASLGVVAAWQALREVLDERASRQAALLVAGAPAFLDFAATSMDAVFFLPASLALWAGLRAGGPRGGVRAGALAGVALLLAAFLSWSALPLGLLLCLHASGARGRRAWPAVAAAGLTFASGALALGLLAGWSILEAFPASLEHARAFMADVRASRPRAEPWRAWLGNPLAFALGAGVPLVALAACHAWRTGWPREACARAALITLAVMSALYDLETERVWIFALPWLAAVGLASGALAPGRLRLLLGLALLQALVLEALLFTLW
ncbi:MAG: glycosyltransferase family 39 protein [Planctomycetes bacterium]|nr:glycosyltransferase family 39 protein [Planctomycetota bacterium]